jgi:hypothetical protein
VTLRPAPAPPDPDTLSLLCGFGQLRSAAFTWSQISSIETVYSESILGASFARLEVGTLTRPPSRRSLDLPQLICLGCWVSPSLHDRPLLATSFSLGCGRRPPLASQAIGRTQRLAMSAVPAAKSRVAQVCRRVWKPIQPTPASPAIAWSSRVWNSSISQRRRSCTDTDSALSPSW